MLAVTSYTSEFIAARRNEVARQLEQYRALPAGKPLAAFSASYFNMMVLALDHMFMHRLRSGEGKDGNPLNEVRMLTAGILEHGGRLTADKTIKYDAAKSVCGIAVGEVIALDAETFARLATAFFDELEKRYSLTN